MNLNEYYIDRLNFNRNLILQSLDDLPETVLQMSAQSVVNSAVYILGHITMSRHYLSNLVSSEKTELQFNEYFGYRHGYDETKTYPPYQDLRSYFEDSSNLLNSNIEKVSDFDQMMETRIPSFSNRLDHVISFLIDHEMYHIGQLSIIRKLNNYKPVPFR